jgi:integrase
LRYPSISFENQEILHKESRNSSQDPENAHLNDNEKGGVHIRVLQELLGHKTLAMTQRYSHLAPEQLQNAVKLLDGIIGER